jgi:hypothetical protein
MNRLSRSLLLITLIGGASLPGTASAQKTYALGVAGGVAIPVGKLGDVVNSGYNATIALAIGEGESPIGVRLDGLYNHFNSQPDVLAPGATTKLRIVAGILNLIYTPAGATAKPYIVVGAGLYNTRFEGSDAKAKNNLGYNGGVGITFGISSFAGFIETRYHSISRKAADGGVIQFIPITLGVMF